MDTINTDEITFDATKNAANIRKRGLPFSLVQEDFDWTTALVVEDTRKDYGERRYRALGLIGGRLHAVVYTPRAGVLHVISLRKANRREENAMPRKRNPYLIDDENPEWTDETFARARPAREVLGEQLGAEVAAKLLKPKRGRPVKAAPKRPTNIRFSPEVLAHFRATGKGWQTRMDEVLKRHVATRTRRPSATKRTSGRRTARA